MANKIQIRRDTTTNWTTADPVLSQGELGLDTLLNKIKIGNGTAHWSELSFYTGNPSQLINGLHLLSVNSSGVVTFPTANNTQLIIEGSKLVGANSNSVAISSNQTVVINTYSPDLHAWEFGNTGTLTIPGPITRSDNQPVQLTSSGSNNKTAAISIDGNNGKVIVRYLGASSQYDWEFNQNGVLKLPSTGLIESVSTASITVGAGLLELETAYTDSLLELTDMFTFNSSVSGYPWSITLPLSAPLTYDELILLSPGTFPNQNIVVPKAHATNLAYSEWRDAAAATEIRVNVSNKSWVFEDTGAITFPTLSVDLHNGGIQSGQVLKFNDTTKQVIITGPTPAAGNSAHRIIIQGQRATGNGEGGDVYLWGGDSDVNGGDIKIYAGDGQASPSNGGYVNISGGSGYAYGGDVTLTAGYASQFGGNVVLSAGNAGGQGGVSGHVTINASSNHSWTFGNDGILTVPGNIATDGNHLTGWSGNLDLNIDGSIKLSADANCALTLQANSHQWNFNSDGSITLPQGSIVSETSNTIAFAPPTAAAGQSLVIRPTTVGWTVNASGYIVYGASQAVFVTTSDSQYFGTVNYTFSGCTAEQLGRALTGQITFPGGGTGNPQSIQWTIPANSNITTFTFTLGSAVGVAGVDHNFEYNGLPDGHFVTVTNNGITNSEFSHVHLVAGNPAIVDMYLGDDDQYVKIEKNAGNVVVGTNLNTHQWTFGTNSNLTLPNASTISPVSQVGYSYGPYTSDIYDNNHGGALSSGTQTVINIGNTVHNNLFDPPVPNATTTTGTIASNGDFEPGTSTGTFDLHTDIIVSGQLLGNLEYRDENNTAAGFTLANPVTPYTGPVVTADTLISGYSGWITRTPKTTTYIRWADGSRSQVTGSSVNLYPNSSNSGLITTDNVSGKLFPATLYTANYIPSGTAIGVNSNDWKFRTDGKLTLPGSTFIDTSPNYIHANHGIGLHPSHNTGGTGPELYIYYDDGIVVQPFTNDYLTPNNAAAPLYISGSNLPNTNDSIGKLPGDIYITGGRNVKDNTYGNVIVNSGITSQWQFNSSGQLTFPDTTIQTSAYQKVAVPAHSYGVTGDKVGMVAFDADYMYYCTANYVDNTTDIWKRTAHGTGTW